MIVSSAWASMGFAMLRSGILSRMAALMGILAGTAGVLAVVVEHWPAIGALSVAIALYFLAIVLLFTWLVLIGRRLLGLASGYRDGRT